MYLWFQSHLLAAVGVMPDNDHNEKTIYLCRRESAARSRRENVKQTLQTFNPAQPDFNMRQHIARCTFSGWKYFQPLKVSPERCFGDVSSPTSNFLHYSCYERWNKNPWRRRAQGAGRSTHAPLLPLSQWRRERKVYLHVRVENPV